MGGKKRKKGSRCCGLTLPAKILQTVFSFWIAGLRFRMRVQKAVSEPMWVILFFFLGAWGEEEEWGGGQDYRDDPAIHPSSKQSPVFPPQTLLIPFWWGVLNKSYFHAFIPHRLLERRSGTQILGASAAVWDPQWSPSAWQPTSSSEPHYDFTPTHAQLPTNTHKHRHKQTDTFTHIVPQKYVVMALCNC